MGDIVKAIEKEKEYLKHRMNGEEPFHLIDVVRECGFETLQDYFRAKSAHNFKQCTFEVIETTPANAIVDIFKTITDKKIAVLFADTEFTLVWNGDNSKFNQEYCIENNIPILPLQTKGGTIVSTVGDLNIGICMPESLGVDSNYLLNELADIFRKYTNKKIDVDGNDIIVDGFKVLGSSVYHTNGMFMFITPVSLSEKSYLIENICLKKSDKIPKHIDFMDGETLKREVSEWLQVRSI